MMIAPALKVSVASVFLKLQLKRVNKHVNLTALDLLRVCMLGLLGLMHVMLLMFCVGSRDTASDSSPALVKVKAEASSYSVPWLTIFSKAPFWYCFSLIVMNRSIVPCQCDQLSGKPGNVREFYGCRGKVMESGKSQEK